jgi:hypothetical protein
VDGLWDKSFLELIILFSIENLRPSVIYYYLTLGFVKSNPDPGILTPLEDKNEKVSKIKHSKLSITKPIINHNVGIPGSIVQDNSPLNNENIPSNGPFPISYFSNLDNPLDSKLISFLKNK